MNAATPQDFKDMGANVVNASSKEECCTLCYTKPTGTSITQSNLI